MILAARETNDDNEIKGLQTLFQVVLWGVIIGPREWLAKYWL